MPQTPKDPFASIAEDPFAAIAETRETPGQRYMTARRAGKLPRYDVGEVAGIQAQQEQEAASPEKYKAGKFAGYRPFVEQMYHGMKSGLIEAGGVTDKLLQGFTDPKTLAAFAVSKLSPAGLAAAQMYFGLQSSQQMADAIQTGKLTPENVQSFLLGAAGYTGAGAMGGETPATIKERLGTVRESARKFARGATEARPVVKETVEKAAQVGQRMSLAEDIDTQSTVVGRQIEQVENKVYQEANRKFEAVKEKIGADRPGEPTENPQPLIDTINGVQNNILRGFPETIPLFRQILKIGGGVEAEALTELRQQVMQGQGISGRYEDLSPERQALVDGIAQRYGGDLTPAQGLAWGQLQRMKTSAETAIRSRSTAPILKEALGQVRNTIIETMGRMAEAKGAGADWQEANNFYRQWREDFHEATGPQGSASPIAQTLEAVDPKNIRQTLSRTQGATQNRAVNILRKYPQFGGNEAAAATEGLIKTHAQSLELPRKAAGVSVGGQPKPTVDIDAVARKQIAQTARRIGRLNAWDFRIIAGSPIAIAVGPFLGFGHVIGEAGLTYVAAKIGLGRMLERPTVINWIATTPADELRSLQQLPNIDRVNVQSALTRLVVEAEKRQRVPVSQALQQFLGPQNMAKILSVSGGSQPLVVKSPKEAKERIPAPVQ